MLLSARSRAGTTSHSLQQDLCFDFQLNEQNQSKRLVENAQKTAFSVSYKDTRNLNGKTLPTSASIECNAGVYVTAIKPALEAIHEGWEKEILGTTLNCIKVSNRFDNSDRLVGTQITLNLQPRNSHQSAKVVLHFYHTSTSTSLLVQGAKLMPEGISSATWFVQFFIEPLACLHISENDEAIRNINTNITNNTVPTNGKDVK